jgi:hypothetical protein
MRRWLPRALGGTVFGVVLFAIIAPTVGTQRLCSGSGSCDNYGGLPITLPAVIGELAGTVLVVALGVWIDRRHP